jgi:hypothetical protein
MTHHRYAWQSLLPDYLRGMGGFGLAAAGVIFLHPVPIGLWLLFGLAFLFLAFALRTGLRQFSTVDVSREALMRRGPFATVIFWREIRALDLRYYSTKRDKSHGWMQLTVRGPGRRRIAFDQTIGDFCGLAARIAAEAEARGVSLSETSRANLLALGIRPVRPEREPEVQPGKMRGKVSG